MDAAFDKIDTQRARINRLEMQIARLSADLARAQEALKYARPLVEKWCHYQGNNKEFFRNTLAPIDAALIDRCEWGPSRAASGFCHTCNQNWERGEAPNECARAALTPQTQTQKPWR